MAISKIVYKEDASATPVTWMDITDTTAGASDVINKYFYTADGIKTLGTASGGGGVSNVVTGTFKGTTTGAAMDVTLNYSGSGYPIAVVVFPSEGVENPAGTFGQLVQRYAVDWFFGFKNVVGQNAEPTYSGGTNDIGGRTRRYKSSSSSATTYSQTSYINNWTMHNDTDATSSTNVCFKSATKMSVFIASTSYGFAANIEYCYYVIYSS